MSWLDIATTSFTFAISSLRWTFFSTVNLVSYSLRLVAWPLAALWNALLFMFAPVIYTVRFLLSPLLAIVQNLPRLEPLYIFFGSAAFVGITVGIILRLTTYTTFALLGLDRDDKPKHARRLYSAGASAKNTQLSLPSQRSHDSEPLTPNNSGPEQRELDALLAGISSSPESDHLVAALRGGAWRDSPNTKRKRRSAAGLGSGTGLGYSRFGTILEEDDDSL